MVDHLRRDSKKRRELVEAILLASWSRSGCPGFKVGPLPAFESELVHVQPGVTTPSPPCSPAVGMAWSLRMGSSITLNYGILSCDYFITALNCEKNEYLVWVCVKFRDWLVEIKCFSGSKGISDTNWWPPQLSKEKPCHLQLFKC